MIKTFKDKETETLFNTGSSRKHKSIEHIVLRKLDMLDAAVDVFTLKIPPANRLEKLSGDRKGQYSIRINSKWRICFKWKEHDAFDVEIVDYH